MTSATPWSVKGIDSKAREVAKDLARRSGMTLGEWLNHMILEGHDVAAVIRDESRRSRPLETRQESRYEESRYDGSRYESGRRKPAPRQSRHSGARHFESGYNDDYSDDLPSEDHDLSRVARVLEGLGTRIENSETRSANAVRGVSQAVESLLNRLERSEEALAENDSLIEARLNETVN
ncbi:MAG: hypothetical protein QM645_13090, partial [Asticcacaulis sp.]